MVQRRPPPSPLAELALDLHVLAMDPGLRRPVPSLPAGRASEASVPSVELDGMPMLLVRNAVATLWGSAAGRGG